MALPREPAELQTSCGVSELGCVHEGSGLWAVPYPGLQPLGQLCPQVPSKSSQQWGLCVRYAGRAGTLIVCASGHPQAGVSVATSVIPTLL